jgi:uncharacterized protein YqfB (UPF0267 family)
MNGATEKCKFTTGQTVIVQCSDAHHKQGTITKMYVGPVAIDGLYRWYAILDNSNYGIRQNQVEPYIRNIFPNDEDLFTL